MHTLIDLGATFRVLSTSADGKLHDVHALDMLAGSRSHLGVVDRLCPPLCVAPSRGLLRHACRRNRWSSPSIRRRRIARRHHLRPDHLPGRTPVRITPNFCGASATPVRQDAGLHSLPAAKSARSAKAAGRWNSSKWIEHLASSSTARPHREDEIWIAVSVCPRRLVKKRLDLPTPRSTLCYRTLGRKIPIHQALREIRCNRPRK